MGVMDKVLNAMKLNEGEGDEDFYDDPDEYYEEPAPISNFSDRAEEGEKTSVLKKVNRVSNMRQTTKKTGNGMEVCVVKPKAFEDAREITEILLSNRTVVLNLEGLDVDIAQRIIDFTYGSVFAMSGNLQTISHYIFIVTPPSVDVSGDSQELLGGVFEPFN